MAELPDGFGYLEPYVDSWGRLNNQEERYLLRQRSDMKALRDFYDASAPRLDEIFSHLDRFPVSEPLPAPESLLSNIAFALAEAAQAVEVYGQPRVPYIPAAHVVSIESTAI